MICGICELEFGDLSQNIGTCHECLTIIVAHAVPDDEEEGSCQNCGEVPDECSCGPRDEDDASPEEGDYISSDDASCEYTHFREHGTGKMLLSVNNNEENWIEAVKAHMDREQYWPSVWFLSDHGNWNLLRLSDG